MITHKMILDALRGEYRVMKTLLDGYAEYTDKMTTKYALEPTDSRYEDIVDAMNAESELADFLNAMDMVIQHYADLCDLGPDVIHQPIAKN